jgi:hypothetical protein
MVVDNINIANKNIAAIVEGKSNCSYMNNQQLLGLDVNFVFYYYLKQKFSIIIFSGLGIQ